MTMVLLVIAVLALAELAILMHHDRSLLEWFLVMGILFTACYAVN